MSSNPEAWEAHPWTTHAATTVTTPDATSITGKRVVAECGTEEDARRIASLPFVCSKVAQCADVLNHHRWAHPSDQCRALSVANDLRQALKTLEKVTS